MKKKHRLALSITDNNSIVIKHPSGEEIIIVMNLGNKDLKNCRLLIAAERDIEIFRKDKEYFFENTK